MADPDPQDPQADGPDLKSFAQDWITIWHSELAAAATDREAQEAWLRAGRRASGRTRCQACHT
jgi:hypothetical protein